MSVVALMPLVQTTLRDPKEAAARIMALNLGRDVLWPALALVALVNTAIVLLLIAVSPPEMVLPGYFASPLALFVLLTGLLVIYVHALYWAGRAIGGAGALEELLALMVWLQALRAAAQLLVMVLGTLIPSLGALMSLVIAVWGFWILLNFIAAALRLPSLLHALGSLVLGGIGVVIGVGVLLFLFGILAQGVLNV